MFVFITNFILCSGLILLFSISLLNPITCCRKPISPQGSIKFYLIFKNGKLYSPNKKAGERSNPSLSVYCGSVSFFFFFVYTLITPPLAVFFSVILSFPNDYNNEALSSASTTDALNILALNLSLCLCLSHCLISTFSVSLIVVVLFFLSDEPFFNKLEPHYFS